MDFIDKAYDITLLTIKEVFVYKVPPLRSASGHRAEDWNLATPLFTGYIRIIQNNNILFIRLYNYKNASSLADNDENLVLFGECPIEVEPKGDIIQFVDAVIDSSRYYVIRLKDRNSTRTTLIGIGFRDRETSFDFKNILNEYVRYVDRMAEAEKLSNETGGKGNESSAQVYFVLKYILSIDEYTNNKRVVVIVYMTLMINSVL
jgi:hypothetical protein